MGSGPSVRGDPTVLMLPRSLDSEVHGGQTSREICRGGRPVTRDPCHSGVTTMGWGDDSARSTRVFESLVNDGLVVIDDEVARLP